MGRATRGPSHTHLTPYSYPQAGLARANTIVVNLQRGSTPAGTNPEFTPQLTPLRSLLCSWTPERRWRTLRVRVLLCPYSRYRVANTQTCKFAPMPRALRYSRPGSAPLLLRRISANEEKGVGKSQRCGRYGQGRGHGATRGELGATVGNINRWYINPGGGYASRLCTTRAPARGSRSRPTALARET